MWFWFVVAFILPSISEWECVACCLGEWSDDMKMLEASPQWEIKALGLWKPGVRPGVFVLPTDGSHYVSCDLEILETPWDTRWSNHSPTNYLYWLDFSWSSHVMWFAPGRGAGFPALTPLTAETKLLKTMPHRPPWIFCRTAATRNNNCVGKQTA